MLTDSKVYSIFTKLQNSNSTDFKNNETENILVFLVQPCRHSIIGGLLSF